MAVDETPQGAAAHTHSKEIVQYLHRHGVRMDIFMAAAIGDAPGVETFLRENPSLAGARGAHGIPLIAHAADRLTAQAMLHHGVACDIVTAVHLGLADQVAKLLNSDPSLSIANSARGISLIQAACAMGHKNVVRVLLNAGVEDPENARRQFLAGGEAAGLRWPGHYFNDMNLHSAVFNDVNLGRPTFHNINMAGALLTDINLRNVTIDSASIEGLKIFGVEVQPLIDKELERRKSPARP